MTEIGAYIPQVFSIEHICGGGGVKGMQEIFCNKLKKIIRKG